MIESLINLASGLVFPLITAACLGWLVYKVMTRPPETEPPADSLSGCLTACILCEYWAAAREPYTCQDCGVCRAD